MNILERIDSVLAGNNLVLEAKYVREGDEPGLAVDMSDPQERLRGLALCRGPSVGWDDYAAGRDYVPPYHYGKKSTLEVGPKDTGRDGVLADYDKVAFKHGPNPYSEKHGGIRPWSPGEILLTIMQGGLLRKIATKGKVQQAAVATHGKQDSHDIEEAMAVGAMAAMQAIPDDEARPGTRFTAYLGTYIQQAMLAGAPPGYADEYRRTRGIRRALDPILKRAIVHARTGDPRLTETKIETDNDGIKTVVATSDLDQIKKVFSRLDICPKCGGTGQIMGYKVYDDEDEEEDPEHKSGSYAKDDNKNKIPEQKECRKCDGRGSTKHIPEGPRHPYGLLLGRLKKLRDDLVRAITSGNAGEIQKEYDIAQKEFDEIEEKEDTYSTTGTTTGGAIGTKPREHGALNAYRRAEEYLEAQRDLANKAIDILGRGVGPKEWQKEVVDVAEKQWKDFSSLEHKDWAPDPDNPRKKEPVYISPYNKYLEPLHEQFVKMLKSSNVQVRDIQDFIIQSTETQRLIRDKEQHKLQSTKATTMDVSTDDGGSIERANLADRGEDTALHNKLHEVATIAVAKLSPYRDDSIERKEQATVAFKVLDAIKKAVDVYIKTKADGGDTTEATQAISRAAQLEQRLSGEWQEEVDEILRNISGAIEFNTGLKDIRRDILDLQKVAKEDTRLKPPEDALTPQEYRIALRMLGIKDYPEKGTPQDPEIDEQGQKSKWAEAGYPPVLSTDPGRKQDLFLWTDVFETTDEHGNPRQAVSDARISTVKRSAEFKVGAMIAKIRQQIGEEFGYDSIDYQIISEAYIAYCHLLIEQALPGGVKLIYS